MLPGWCCIAIATLELGNGDVRFQVPFLGPESQLKSGFACADLLCSRKSELVEDRYIVLYAVTIIQKQNETANQSTKSLVSVWCFTHSLVWPGGLVICFCVASTLR